MLSMLYTLFGILAILSLITLGVSLRRSAIKHNPTGKKLLFLCCFALVIQIFITMTAFFIYRSTFADLTVQAPARTDPTDSTALLPESDLNTFATEPDFLESFRPKSTLLSDPQNFKISWQISAENELVDHFIRNDPICFPADADYFALPGIATFRGNHHRSTATYGTAVVENEQMDIVWSHPIGSLNKWGGCAWTGQPLLVQWDRETKAIMNLYDSKKEKDDLVEVIYATLDGYIHFYDLEDGTQTRNPINVGINFMGSGSLDPRGYSLLYVGSGVYINGAVHRMFVINLITGRIIYEYGHEDDFPLRDWNAYDSCPLVDAESDTLIWPGENGVLYTFKLNTTYDMVNGTIEVSPDAPVKTRYTSYYTEEDERSLGYESSPVIVDHYLFASENSGLIQCVDLDTMSLVWAQDLKDASCSSPVFEWGEDGKGYVYAATNLHWTADGHNGTISIYKLDASNGEIVWEYQRDCVRYDEIAGGVQCAPLLGKKDTNIEGLVIYSISRTPSAYRGVLVALDVDTGEKIWEISSGNYAWSSPAAFYTEDGHSYIFLANASGIARLIDGATGQVLMTLNLDETVEASPVIFEDKLVIGTREAVYCIKIS